MKKSSKKTKAAKPRAVAKVAKKRKTPAARSAAPVRKAKAAPAAPKAMLKKLLPVATKAGKGRPSASSEVVAPPKNALPKKELAFYRDQLLRLRDRIVDEISFLANDSLNRSQKDSSGDLSSHSFHMADQGTDNFDREFAASLLSSEQDVLYEIDEALRRIDQGTYGICEMSGRAIEKERLKVLPFARYSVAVQSEMERGRPRYRPFRRTSIQTAETNT